MNDPDSVGPMLYYGVRLMFIANVALFAYGLLYMLHHGVA